MRIYRHTRKVNGEKRTSNVFYTDLYVKGRRHRVPLYSDKGTSQSTARWLSVVAGQYESGAGYDKAAQDWIDRQSPAMVKRLAGMGLVSSQRASASKGITDHIAEFKASLVASGSSPAHLAALIPRVERIVTACRFRTLTDFDAGKVERYLSGLRDQGETVTLKQIDKSTGKPKIVKKTISPITYNYHIRAIRQFCQWLVDRGRMHESPVKGLRKVEITSDDQVRHCRVLTVDELRSLIQTTLQAPDWRGVPGRERALIYLVANESGLRAGEIRQLKVSDFDFTGCLIRVRSSISKNNKADTLPMKASTAAMIQDHLAGKGLDEIALTVKPEAYRMIQHDLKLAGIEYQTSDGVAHFHSLRHGFASRLDEVVLRGSKTAVDLLRHGDARLTISRYTHSFDQRERDAINALPDLIVNKMHKEKQA